MKICKKVLSYFLIVCFLFGANVVCGQSEEISYEKEYQLLVDLGIMRSGVNLQQQINNKDTSEAIFNIVGAKNDYVGITYGDTLKSLVDLLGYTLYTSETSKSYLKKADDINLTCGLKIPLNKTLNYNEFSKLLYNAINVEILMTKSYGDTIEYVKYKDKTLLSEYMQIYKAKGTVTATTYTGLKIPNTGIQKDYIQIGNVLYLQGSLKMDNLLGYQIEYYYHYVDESSKTIKGYLWRDNQNKILKVLAQDIMEVSKGQLVYDENVKRKIQINSLKNVLYNGKAYNDLKEKDFLIKNGEISFLDSDGDSAYETVFIYEYENYKVDSISYDRGVVVDNTIHTAKKLDFQIQNGNVNTQYYKNGKEVTINDIGVGQIITVFKSKDGNLNNVFISSNTIEGTVNEIKKDSVIIENTEYNLYGNVEVKVGERATYLLDMYSKVSAKQDVAIDGVVYAILLAVGTTMGIDKTLSLKVYDTAGQLKVLNSDKKIVYCDKGKIDSLLLIEESEFWDKNASNSKNAKPIKVVLNSKGLIKEIQLAKVGNDMADKTQFRKTFDKLMKYYKVHTRSFVAPDISSTMFVKGSGAIFNIPDKIEKDEDVTLLSSSFFKDNYDYIVEGYSFTDSKYVDIVICYMEAGNTKQLSTTPAFFIESKSNIVHKGEEAIKITGCYDNNKASFIIDDDKFKNVDCGDVILLKANKESEIQNMMKIFDFKTKTHNAKISGINQERTLYGNVVQYKENIITVLDDGGVLRDYMTVIGKAKAYEYNTSNSKTKIVGLNNIQPDDTVFIRINEEMAMEIIIIK